MKLEIETKLRELKKYAQLLRDYQKHSKKELKTDMTVRGAVERYMQLAIEIVIEIGEMIIAEKCFKKPETYREVIEILGKNNVLRHTFAKKLAPAAGFRNILIHRYGKLDLNELYRHLQEDVNDFDIFIRQISKYLSKK